MAWLAGQPSWLPALVSGNLGAVALMASLTVQANEICSRLSQHFMAGLAIRQTYRSDKNF
jgi:hypothetical protein